MEIRYQVPLAPFTTLGVGGPARHFIDVRSNEDARAAVLWAREHDEPLFILGGGSNLVISDKGWPGTVTRVAIDGVERQVLADKQLAYDAGAGLDWDALVQRCVADGCGGIECLSGIPGSVGGTPVQNVGAYGQEVSETIRWVDALDLVSLDCVRLQNLDCGFTYRRSRFNGADRGRYMILRVSFGLRQGVLPVIRYAELKSHFNPQNGTPSLEEVRNAVLEIRRSKAMLVEDSEPDSRSAGSFFKNPLASRPQYEAIAECWQREGVAVPKFDSDDGRVKIPAGWLVEHAGIRKGFELGAVAISRRHALALVNRGGATAADVLRLKELIQQRVRDAFGIELEPEPVFVGFDQA